MKGKEKKKVITPLKFVKATVKFEKLQNLSLESIVKIPNRPPSAGDFCIHTLHGNF